MAKIPKSKIEKEVNLKEGERIAYKGMYEASAAYNGSTPLKNPKDEMFAQLLVDNSKAFSYWMAYSKKEDQTEDDYKGSAFYSANCNRKLRDKPFINTRTSWLKDNLLEQRHLSLKDISVLLEQRLYEANRNGDDTSVVKYIDIWAKLTGNYAKEKIDVTSNDQSVGNIVIDETVVKSLASKFKEDF